MSNLLRFAKVLSALLFAAMFFISAEANAAYMDCMEKSRGREIIWDSSWTKDNKDNGTRYKITNVEIHDRIPNRWVRLTMRAVSRHSRKRRVYTIETEEKARAFCERLVREISRPKYPIGDPIAEETPEAADESAAGLPFIRFSSVGWVRAEPPTGKPLAVCRVLKTKFACLETEKQRFGASLRELEESLRWRVRDK